MTAAALGLRRYTEEDRRLAHAVLRRCLAAGRVPFAIHPGDWDWWRFHADPRVPPPEVLVGDRALVELALDGELNAFGLTAAELAALVDDPALPVPVRRVGSVAEQDAEREAALRAAGFEPVDEAPSLSFELPLSPGGIATRPVADGYRLQVMDVDTQVDSRADAARLAFGSTMPFAQHRARYRSFTQSPGYPDCLDLVAAVARDGRHPGDPVAGEVAAFTVLWPDDGTSTVLLEPVGTHPEHVRRGLARAVILEGLSRMAARGIRTARVYTEQDRPAAPALYLACGFTVVDRLRRWERPG